MLFKIMNFFEPMLVPIGLIGLTWVYYNLCGILLSYIVNRSSVPFQRFWNRLSKVLRLLFKDMQRSFTGKLELLYNNSEEEDLLEEMSCLGSPQESYAACEILAMSPREVVLTEVPSAVNRRRRNVMILPRMIQPDPVPT